MTPGVIKLLVSNSILIKAASFHDINSHEIILTKSTQFFFFHVEKILSRQSKALAHVGYVESAKDENQLKCF